MGGREEGFEETSDGEEGDGAGEEADGLVAGEGEGVAAAEHAGEEKAGGEAESGTAGDEDAGEFEGSVGGDEGPDIEGHVVLGAGGGDDAYEHAVVEHEEDAAEAGEDSGGEGHEADADVVGHDGAGGLGFGGEDGVGPHLVVLDFIDHGGAKHGVHELRAGES